MKNLKAQATILAIIFIAAVSAALVGYLYLQNRDLKSQLGNGNEAVKTPVPSKPEVNPSTPTQPTAVPTDETANWKTYTNTPYLFKIEYPKRFVLTENSKREDFYDALATLTSPLKKETMVISAIHDVDVYKNLKPEEMAEREIMDSGFKYDITKTKIGDYAAAITSFSDDPRGRFPTITVAHPTKNLFIVIDLKADLSRVEFERILSTFKFLDPAGSSEPVNFYSFSGQLILNGYFSTLERSCAFTEDNNCQVKLAVFTVLTADNPQFSSFLKDLAGNAFAANDGIILGCIDTVKKQINSSNDADTGTVENLISGGQYDLLAGSSPTKPVNLSLEKPKLTGGRGAPDCYSHFRNFKVY